VLGRDTTAVFFATSGLRFMGCTYHPCLVHLHNGRFSKGDLYRILDAKIDLRY